MDLTEHIQLVGKHMAQVLIGGLKTGSIALDRSREIAQYYLNKVRVAQSETELKQDLQEMEQTMPEMKDVVLMEKMRDKEASEQALRDQVEVLLKEGKIEEAAALAQQIKK